MEAQSVGRQTDAVAVSRALPRTYYAGRAGMAIAMVVVEVGSALSATTPTTRATLTIRTRLTIARPRLAAWMRARAIRGAGFILQTCLHTCTQTTTTTWQKDVTSG